jgi:hypothetical protein
MSSVAAQFEATQPQADFVRAFTLVDDASARAGAPRPWMWPMRARAQRSPTVAPSR